jgi:hypothetical protein
MPPKTTRADFEALVRRAGLALTPQQIADIHTHAWPVLEKMAERVRGTDRGPEAEPSHVFTPEGA